MSLCIYMDFFIYIQMESIRKVDFATTLEAKLIIPTRSGLSNEKITG